MRLARNVFTMCLIVLMLMLLSACQPSSSQSALNPKLPPYLQLRSPVQRCLDELQQVSGLLPSAVDDIFASLPSGTKPDDDIVQSFEQAVDTAGLRHALLELVIESSPDNEGGYLVAVSWCYPASRYDLYIVEPGEGSVFLAEDQSPPDIRLPGDVWAIITDIGSGLHVMTLDLLIYSQGEWAYRYRSSDPPAGDPLLWSSPTLPTFSFEDGYEQLTVAIDQDNGIMVEKIYRWTDDHYIQTNEREIGP